MGIRTQTAIGMSPRKSFQAKVEKIWRVEREEGMRERKKGEGKKGVNEKDRGGGREKRARE